MPPGLPLIRYFDEKTVKGFRMRCSNQNYPFDGCMMMMVDSGKDMVIPQFFVLFLS